MSDALRFPPPAPRPPRAAPPPPPGGADAGVVATNEDAQVSKLSAVRAGYFRDDFVHLLVRRPARRPPLINLGYWSRHAALRGLLLRFLGEHGGGGARVQVLSLGAGHDTAFFQLAAEGLLPAGAVWAELDLPPVAAAKAAALAGAPPLREALDGAAAAGTAAAAAVSIDAGAGVVTAGRYRLRPCDLRAAGGLAAAAAAAGLDARAPTLLLAECVLVYLDPAEGAAVAAAAAAHFRRAVFVVYEQTSPGDAFGREMVRNLAARGCPLRGLLGAGGTATLAAHEARFTGAGWAAARATSMADVHARWLPAPARRRAEALEPLDELEEWRLIQAHYCIVVAAKDDDEDGGPGAAGGGGAPSLLRFGSLGEPPPAPPE